MFKQFSGDPGNIIDCQYPAVNRDGPGDNVHLPADPLCRFIGSAGAVSIAVRIRTWDKVPNRDLRTVLPGSFAIDSKTAQDGDFPVQFFFFPRT